MVPDMCVYQAGLHNTGRVAVYYVLYVLLLLLCIIPYYFNTERRATEREKPERRVSSYEWETPERLAREVREREEETSDRDTDWEESWRSSLNIFLDLPLISLSTGRAAMIAWQYEQHQKVHEADT